MLSENELLPEMPEPELSDDELNNRYNLEYQEYQNRQDFEKASLSDEAVFAASVIEAGAVNDYELVPLTGADIIYSKFIFNAEANLRLATGSKWLIDGIIPVDAFGVLYGQSGCYKSFIALDLAASIASSSRQWHGMDVDQPGPVLYVAAEGAFGLQERAVAWEKHYGKRYGQMVILPKPVMMDNVLETQNFVEAAMMVQEKIGKPFSFVVIDTMARSFSGDENSAQDSSGFVNSCSRWRSKLGNCTVMIVTHAGKNVERGMRGSSALKGACDFVFSVSRPNHLQALLKNEKQKDFDEAEDMRFALQSTDLEMQDHKGRNRKSLVPILESRGANADPDKAEKDETFASGDAHKIWQMVRAAEVRGDKVTEDKLKEDYVGERESGGTSRATALKAFKRAMDKAKGTGQIVKDGIHIFTIAPR